MKRRQKNDVMTEIRTRDELLAHVSTIRPATLDDPPLHTEPRCAEAMLADPRKARMEIRVLQWEMRAIEEAWKRKLDGFQPSWVFRNQVDEVTPCNSQRYLFYFELVLPSVPVQDQSESQVWIDDDACVVVST